MSLFGKRMCTKCIIKSHESSCSISYLGNGETDFSWGFFPGEGWPESRALSTQFALSALKYFWRAEGVKYPACFFQIWYDDAGLEDGPWGDIAGHGRGPHRKEGTRAGLT